MKTKRIKTKDVRLDMRQLRQLARDAVILAAAVKLYVPPNIGGLHPAAAKRVLKLFVEAQTRIYRPARRKAGEQP